MNTEHLRYILKIDEYKSINKAAKELYIAQPTLSRILQSMEDAIGITIFTRTNKGVEVTEEGADFLKRAGGIIAEMDNFEYDYFSTEELPKDAVNLIIDSHRSTPAVDALIRFYMAKCEDSRHINVVFHEDTVEDILESVSQRKADIGLVSWISSQEDYMLQHCYDMGLKCLLINDCPLCMQVSTHHPLAGCESVTLDQLKDYTMMCFSDENLLGINYCTNTSKFNWDVDRRRVVTNSRGVLKSLLGSTDGYYLGNNAKSELLDSQGTVCIPVRDYPYTVKTVCVYNKKRELTSDERMYIKYLEEAFVSLGSEEVNETFSYIKE